MYHFKIRLHFIYVYIFIAECPKYLTLPYLNGAETSCITLDTCTGIRCCVEAVSLGRSFVMSFELDACNFMLTINIDKFVHNESLVNYVYGKYLNYLYLKAWPYVLS